jgi:23S rRNA-/tRNA-specific pseudouridylate synthase
MGGSRYFSQSLSPRPKSAKGVVRHSSLKKKNILSIYALQFVNFLVRALQDIAPLSLVRLYPHTGLKHQLRVHMAHALKGTLGRLVQTS